MRIEKIGNVRFVNLQDETEAVYSDGGIEDKLLTLFKKKRPNIEQFQLENPGWATTYHLSPVRRNLFNWYDFKPGSRVLEVGSGCGAITELLTQSDISITSLELSERRAKINAHRNKTANNLEIIRGNLENLDSYSDERYDYVVCIGVLEYAGRFISGPNPFEIFLNILKNHLKPDGVLILAIENKLGLKYFSGSREDHVQRYMEGIEDYPHYDGIRTFGKRELVHMMEGAGFSETRLYYPVPDYKMPHTVYSDDYLPGVHTQNIPSSFYPTPNPDQPREQVFREQLGVRSVAKNGLYGELANSFLVFASPTKLASNNKVIYAHGSLSRNEELSTITRFTENNGKILVEKSAANKAGKNHIDSLGHKEKLIKTAIAGNKKLEANALLVTTTKSGKATFEYTDGISMQDELINALLGRDKASVIDVIASFVSIIDSFKVASLIPNNQKGFKDVLGTAYQQKTECISPAIIDLNLDNILHDAKDKYTLIDYEWTFDFAIPKEFLITRSLVYFFKRHDQIIRAICGPELPCIQLAHDLLVPKFIIDKFGKYFESLEELNITEACFQAYVSSKSTTVSTTDNMHTLQSSELADNAVDSYVNSRAIIAAQDATIKEKNGQITELETRLHRITDSTSWRLVRKAAAAKNKLRRPKKR